MTQFSISPDGLALTWTGSGEYLRIEPWSKDSVRVRASKMHEPSDFDYALQCSEKVHRQAVIEIDSQKDEATLTNGQIVVKANAYHSCNAASGYEEFHCALSFYKKRRYATL